MNEFREWLSDNLRYIMLGTGILLGLVVIFFGIRYITSAIDTNPNNPQIEADATLTPSPAMTATPTPTPSVEVLVMEDLVENGVPEITALIQDYYNAIASNNLNALRMLVDNLSIEDEATITADTVTSYTDIRVFTKVTNTPGVYIVFASYKYYLSGINTAVPGLTQLCVHTANDGSLYVSTAGPNATLQAEIDQVIRSSEAQNLIDNIRTQYETALDSDPALYAYFHGTQPSTNNTGNNNSGNNNSGNNNFGNNNSGNNNSGNNNSGNNNSGNNTSSNNNSSNNNSGNNNSGSNNSGNNNSGNNNSGNNNFGNNNSGNNSSNNNGRPNSNNNSANATLTPEPTWAPGSRPTIDTDGGVIPTPEPPDEYKLELKEKTSLYEKADINSDTIRTYPANTQMVKIGESGDFYEVDIHGEIGYMLKSSFK